MIKAYDWKAAIRYAKEWAHLRNPAYYDYENIGGDCTNYISQCVYAGSMVMNYAPVFGWYYINGNQKSPSWTGVPFFYNFMVRSDENHGPFGIPCSLQNVWPGDIIQLSFDGVAYTHSLMAVSVIRTELLPEILVTTHSENAFARPLSSYSFAKSRCIHILGVRL